jgi:DNA-binding CsgD family transcriptional regulator
VAGRPPSRALADALNGRSGALLDLGQYPEAAEDARRALAVAREVGYPVQEVLALVALALAAAAAGDLGEAVRLARQADQFPGGLRSLAGPDLQRDADGGADPGRRLRHRRAGLRGSSRQRPGGGDLRRLPYLLSEMAVLDLRAGRAGDAAARLREALQLLLRTGTWNPDALDYCGHLCAATGRPAEAVTPWAAHAALIRRKQDWRREARNRQELLRAARQALGPDRARAAEQCGAAMSRAAAAEYALLLTEHPGPRQPGATPGLGGLSARERELVTLVAQGHTVAQIAARLYISPRTVSSHLDRIRDKTGARRRADLTRLALAAGLV